MVWDLKIYFYVNLYADSYSVSEIWSGSSSFRVVRRDDMCGMTVKSNNGEWSSDDVALWLVRR
jgi:hypothetical protein